MKYALMLAVIAVVAMPVASQTFVTSSPLPAALADGLGTCIGTGGPVTLSITTSGIVVATGVSLNFTFAPAHTWYGDLACTVTNPSGVAARAMIDGCTGPLFFDDASDVAGPYTLSDGAAVTFDAAALALAGGTIFAGTYGPDESLNNLLACGNPNGVWTVTFTDAVAVDTGTVSACSLSFGTAAPADSFTVCQASAGSPVNFIHSAGAVAITYTNVATIATPSAVPNGWWFGLDVSLTGPFGLIDQLTNSAFGPIFIGTLPAGGVQVFPIALPLGFNFQMVGVHFNTAGIAIFAAPPVNYTVL